MCVYVVVVVFFCIVFGCLTTLLGVIDLTVVQCVLWLFKYVCVTSKLVVCLVFVVVCMGGGGQLCWYVCPGVNIV